MQITVDAIKVTESAKVTLHFFLSFFQNVSIFFSKTVWAFNEITQFYENEIVQLCVNKSLP